MTLGLMRAFLLVAVCTIPVNLRESAPFASMHRPDFVTGTTTAAWDTLVTEGTR